VLYQIAAVAGVAAAEGVRLQHVKPHGALFNMAARDPAWRRRSRARSRPSIPRSFCSVSRALSYSALVAPPASAWRRKCSPIARTRRTARFAREPGQTP
jgi:hypothetical protein